MSSLLVSEDVVEGFSFPSCQGLTLGRPPSIPLDRKLSPKF